jgi:hypothetical protein
MPGTPRNRLAALGAIAAGLVFAGTAAGAVGKAQTVKAATSSVTTTAPTTTAPTTTAPAPTPGTPAAGSLVLYLRGAYAVHHQQVTIPHRAVQVDGIVRPYVAGQWVTMHLYSGGRLVHKYDLPIKPAAGGKYGEFSYGVSSPRVGDATVVVQHAATSTLGAFESRHGFEAVDDHVSFGSRGAFVQLVQERLSALHFYIPQTGVYDMGTGLALDAYHRLLGWGVYQTLDARTINALLKGAGRFKVHYPGDGRHAEGDLGDQLLALINGSHVVWIFPISSGKPSTPTILGRFHVYLKDPGYLPDGMYYSNFFYSGYAIHGYDPAPDYPASHGCMRLPIVDAITVYDWLQLGYGVDVYN